MFGFMNSLKLFLLLCLIIPLIARIKGQTYSCSPTTYAQNSTFQTNVHLLLSSLSSNASQSDDGFYNSTIVGQEKNSNATGAIGWYDKCWLRYSGDEYFFSKMQEQPQRILVNTGNATNTTSFMNLLGETLKVAAKEASQGGSEKFATKIENYSSFQSLYTMAQCTPDISETGCLNCLAR
ncbi:hypothetical protein K1719_002330 [Acacia pycnantha]|nr:hypothetical protein K1719_002330 [Acacia pycnantha]